MKPSLYKKFQNILCPLCNYIFMYLLFHSKIFLEHLSCASRIVSDPPSYLPQVPSITDLFIHPVDAYWGKALCYKHTYLAGRGGGEGALYIWCCSCQTLGSVGKGMVHSSITRNQTCFLGISFRELEKEDYTNEINSQLVRCWFPRSLRLIYNYIYYITYI